MQVPQHRWKLRLIGIAAAGALIMTACGDDSSSSSAATASSSSGGGSASNTTAAAGAAGGSLCATPNKATGAAVKVGYFGDGQSAAVDQSDTDRAGLAAIKYVNDCLGGLAGHPIDPAVCDTKGDIAIATDCANKFVSDNVVLVVGYNTGQMAPIAKIVQAAKIPLFVGSGTDGATDKATSFYFSNGLASFVQPAAVARENKFTKAATIVIDVPSASGPAKTLGTAMMKNAGVTQVDVVAVPPGTADMNPQVQAMMSKNPQLIHVLGNASFCATAFKALQDSGYKGVITAISPCIDGNTIKSAGSFLKGIKVGYAFTIDPKDPDVILWPKIIQKYGDPSSTPFRFSTAAAVGTVITLANVFKGYTGDLSNQALTAWAKSAKNIPLSFGGGLTMTCDGTQVPPLPAVCTAGVLQSELDASGQPTTFTQVDTNGLMKIG